MKEIITQEHVNAILRFIAITAPIAGLVIGIAVGSVRKRAIAGLFSGLLIGLTGTAVYGLWWMYTAVGKRYGYTSTGSLAVQLLIFAGIGFGAGFMIQRWLTITPGPRKHEGKEPSWEESPNAGKNLYR